MLDVLKAKVTQCYTLPLVAVLLSGTEKMVLERHSRGAPWSGVGSCTDLEVGRPGFESWMRSLTFLFSFLILVFAGGLTSCKLEGNGGVREEGHRILNYFSGERCAWYLRLVLSP